MPLCYKFLYSDLVLFYKILNDLVPIDLPDYVTRRTNTRSSSDGPVMFGLSFDNPSNHKSVFTHSFFPRCISNWNNLPSDVRSSISLNEFCSNIRAWIWASVASQITEFSIEPD